MNEILADVGFSDKENSPYDGYENTIIDYSKNCYVIFPSETERDEYILKSATDAEMQAANVTTLGYGTHFLTHETPCGACSDLENLATYLSVTDLTNPVRSCGFKLIERNQIECLEDVGFRDHCTWIWKHNTANTKRTSGNGGCFGVCLLYVNADNIEESGTDNYCDPDRCENSINGGPACSDDQWQNGPYRLNPCLQCDECRSGPLFQKVAGRTRRDSGIPSAIPRPPEDVVRLTHVYGKWKSPTPNPTPAPVSTPSPVTNPTPDPTPVITSSPTKVPTSIPTSSPTIAPTEPVGPIRSWLAWIVGGFSCAAVIGFGAYRRRKSMSNPNKVEQEFDTWLEGKEAKAGSQGNKRDTLSHYNVPQKIITPEEKLENKITNYLNRVDKKKVHLAGPLAREALSRPDGLLKLNEKFLDKYGATLPLDLDL
eukprot:CAMPEP_0184014094 /NCGR_PEP_ID=MMETSP0954-20121128/5433_1 /TAXON_ID=627963 /ORGANISM="Aplanochytrium sp, Strain PBS07" /LENGTH=426 /DNA_ID=CAMNT_0026294467 /DNA_START=182 /DNA_END=1462 /DNA_ORIENTATION=-